MAEAAAAAADALPAAADALPDAADALPAAADALTPAAAALALSWAIKVAGDPDDEMLVMKARLSFSSCCWAMIVSRSNSSFITAG
jgi:hypothetical protein